MKRLLAVISIAGLILAGCGNNISQECSGLSETLSSRQEAAVALQGIQKKSVVNEDVGDGSRLTAASQPIPEQTATPFQGYHHTYSHAHTHTYVEETVAATCTDAATIITKCRFCGEVSQTRKEGSALEHEWEKVIYSTPTCAMDGYGYLQCKHCGLQKDYETLAKLPHDCEETVVQEGDCHMPRVTEKVCRICDIHQPREYDYDAHREEHNWETKTEQIYDRGCHTHKKVTRTICSVCNKEKPDSINSSLFVTNYEKKEE